MRAVHNKIKKYCHTLTEVSTIISLKPVVFVIISIIHSYKPNSDFRRAKNISQKNYQSVSVNAGRGNNCDSSN